MRIRFMNPHAQSKDPYGACDRLPPDAQFAEGFWAMSVIAMLRQQLRGSGPKPQSEAVSGSIARHQIEKRLRD